MKESERKKRKFEGGSENEEILACYSVSFNFPNLKLFSGTFRWDTTPYSQVFRIRSKGTKSGGRCKEVLMAGRLSCNQRYTIS